MTLEDILRSLKVEPANRWAQAKMQKIAKNKTLVIKLYEEDDNWERDLYEASRLSLNGYGSRAVWTARQMDNRILVVTISQIGSMIYKEYLEHGYVDIKYLTR